MSCEQLLISILYPLMIYYPGSKIDNGYPRK